MAEGTALEATLGLLPSASCPVLAQVWVNTTVLCCCHLWVPLILPWGLSLVTLCTLRFHVLLTTALVRTLSAHLKWGHGLALLAPASPGWLGALPEQHGSMASLSGKVQGSINGDWPSTLLWDRTA